MSKDFADIVSLIQQSRSKAYQAVNAELVNLYWQVGGYISRQVTGAGWGKSVVAELGKYIAITEPSAKGFSDKNLWRMKQFYETYKDAEILASLRREIEDGAKLAPARREFKNGEKQIVSPLVTQFADIRKTLLAQLSWTHHRTIFGSCKTEEEREFYIRLSIKEQYSVKQLERQMSSSLFERAALSNTAKLSTVLRVLPDEITGTFKDSYVFEFLNLPEPHSENDFQKAIIRNLKQFLLEFSRDFAYLGEEFLVQVGNKDFAIDLLFFNRALNCLVAIELKVVDFAPEHLAKLNFYLEALDRDVKKPHENPSIGILLCKAKDDEVVEYAMSRQLSPAMVAKYQLQLPDKKLLRARLHEFFEQELKEND